jgi:hypothetical protein
MKRESRARYIFEIPYLLLSSILSPRKKITGGQNFFKRYERITGHPKFCSTRVQDLIKCPSTNGIFPDREIGMFHRPWAAFLLF